MPGSHFNTVPVPYRLKHTHCIYHYLFSSFTVFLVWNKNSLENCGKDGKSNCSEAWQMKPTRTAGSVEGGSGEQGALPN